MAVILTSSVPTFNTADEHRALVASTPENFADIPPILRHKQANVRVSFDPCITSQPEWSVGTLYVMESFLVFIQDGGKEGFQIEYPAITLHAISRAEGEIPNIYCQLDDNFGNLEAVDSEADDMRELIITPSDPASLDPIFEALSFCASLHPDEPSQSDDEDDAFLDADEFDASDDEEEELSEVGKATLDRLESIIDCGGATEQGKEKS